MSDRRQRIHDLVLSADTLDALVDQEVNGGFQAPAAPAHQEH